MLCTMLTTSPGLHPADPSSTCFNLLVVRVEMSPDIAKGAPDVAGHPLAPH